MRFIPSASWVGPREGYFFGTGSSGTGYVERVNSREARLPPDAVSREAGAWHFRVPWSSPATLRRKIWLAIAQCRPQA